MGEESQILRKVLEEIKRLEKSDLSSEEMVAYLSSSDIDWSSLYAYSLISGKERLAEEIIEAKREISRRTIASYEHAILEGDTSSVLSNMSLGDKISLRSDYQNPFVMQGRLGDEKALEVLESSIQQELLTVSSINVSASSSVKCR